MAYSPRLPKSHHANPGAIVPQEKVRLLELRKRQIEIEQQKRIRLENPVEEIRERIVGIEAKNNAYAAAFPLRRFIYETFPVLEPGYEFKSNWHIDAMSELLTAATVGEVKNFIINIPPRCMKSSLFCVMWFCWVWSFLPHTRWMFASYSERFAKRDGASCKRLLESAYYQNHFGTAFNFSTPNTPANFYNDKLGFRKAFGVKGGVGDGADFLMTDDPNRIDDFESEKMLEQVVNWYINTYYNRVNDPVNAVRGNIQQRTGVGDLTGYILEKELDFQILCLPMNWEDDHPYTNKISKPLKLGRVTAFDVAENPTLIAGEEKLLIDPRQKEAPNFDNRWYQNFYKNSYASKGGTSDGEGEYLWKDRFTPEYVKDLIKTVEVYGESAQLQQRPHPKGGTFFNIDNFKRVKQSQVPVNNLYLMRYWDKAGSDGKGDWTVGTLIGRTKQRPYKFFILDMHRVQLSYFDRMAEMKRIASQDMFNYILNNSTNDYFIGIEREGGSSGKDVSLIEKEELIGYNVWVDYKQTSKESRASIVRQRSEGGYILVLENGVWNPVFFKRLARYKPAQKGKSNNTKDDEIDTIGGALYYLAFMLNQQQGSSSGYM